MASVQVRFRRLFIGNYHYQRNPGLKRSRTGAIFKKFIVKTTFSYKRDPEYFELQFYWTKPSVGLPNLVRLSL
jgi:hypothetical protein